MSDRTRIEWSDATWNPVRGCSQVSEGCRNCYAMRIAARFSKPGQAFHGLARMTKRGPQWTRTVRVVEDALDLPQRWRRPRRVFVNSMSDLFHEALPSREIRRVLDVIADTPRHTFQVLTKRPRRMRDELRQWERVRVQSVPRNLWVGVSIESADVADRADVLVEMPGVIRFVSVEPMLGPVSLARFFTKGRGIQWVIAGGESGPGARQVLPGWLCFLRDECEEAAVPFFFKQWGASVGDEPEGVLDGRTWRQFPEPGVRIIDNSVVVG